MNERQTERVFGTGIRKLELEDKFYKQGEDIEFFIERDSTYQDDAYAYLTPVEAQELIDHLQDLLSRTK